MGTRQINGVTILDWPSGGRESPVVAEVRALLDGGPTHVLLDMGNCGVLCADQLEALTEALRLCQDRQAQIGLFGLGFEARQLLAMLALEEELPPILGDGEPEALAAINGGGDGDLEFEIDLGAPAQAGLDPMAPTARFAAGAVMDVGNLGAAAPTSAPTARFSLANVVGEAAEDADDAGGLLTVFWADLASQGYVIGGDGADEIMAAVSGAPATTAAPGEPAGKAGSSLADSGEIDLGDVVPAQRGPGAPAQRPPARTEMMPAFDFEEESKPAAAAPGGAGWSAKPSGAVEIDFGAGAAMAPALDAGQGALFGGGGVFGGGDFQPVDSGMGPPPAAVQARVEPGPGAQPAAAPGAGGAYAEDSDETVMFQPGALDQALLQASLQAAAEAAAAEAAAPEPAPVAAAPAPTAPLPQAGDDYDLDSDDETVMIQPGMLDAALLAEVAAAAGAPTELPAPPVEAPPAAPVPEALSGSGVVANALPDGREVELMLFVHDFAIRSDLHLRVLDRFAQSSDRVLGPQDLQGGGDVQPVLDQFVQSRLLRRARSPRIRGGSGFVFSASPQTRNTVVRLLKMWADPRGRAKLSSWLQGA
ncbi:MAG: hypothetical protein AB7N76_36400 [Planctomycetota bacterium]